MQITIKNNFPSIQKRLGQLSDDIRDKALASALNKVTDQARTQMTREITKEYNVKAAYVRDRLKITRARWNKGAVAMQATLTGSGRNGRSRSANVIAFLEKSVTLAQARKRGKSGTLAQLHFQIKKSGGKKIIPGAFIGNKGRTVFIREGKARLPIKAVRTIDVPSMFNQRRINATVTQLIKDKLPSIFERDVKFYTDRFNAP